MNGPKNTVRRTREHREKPCSNYNFFLERDDTPRSQSRLQALLQSNSSTASAVASWMRPQSPFLTQALSIIHDPPTHITFGSAMYFFRLSALTPPVGQKRTSLNGPPRALIAATPPLISAGNSLKRR